MHQVRDPGRSMCVCSALARRRKTQPGEETLCASALSTERARSLPVARIELSPAIIGRRRGRAQREEVTGRGVRVAGHRCISRAPVGDAYRQRSPANLNRWQAPFVSAQIVGIDNRSLPGAHLRVCCMTCHPSKLAMRVRFPSPAPLNVLVRAGGRR